MIYLISSHRILSYPPDLEIVSSMSPIIPIYYQIKQAIKNWIISKEFNLGDKIPSENELVDKFNVSRLTVRQAISQLRQEGFLISKRGEGTFVTTDQNLLNSLNIEFRGLMGEIFYKARKAETTSMAINRIIAPKYVQEKLELGEKPKEIVQIKRVRTLADRPFQYVISYLPLEIGLKIPQNELYKKPLLEILAQDLGIQLFEAFQTISASFLEQEVAKELKVQSGLPALFVERIVYAKKKKPVDLAQIFYRGDLFKYIVRLKNVKRNGINAWVHQKESRKNYKM